MNNIYINNIMNLRYSSLLMILLIIIPSFLSCEADDQFENDPDYSSEFGDVDSFPMRLITPDALQGTWNCKDNSKITFLDDSFSTDGSALGTISGKYKITGNTIRVYHNGKRIAYFPIIHFKRFMDIRHQMKTYRFAREGDDPNDSEEGNNEPEVIPLNDSGFFGVWQVSKASIDGESVYLDVNWHNSRLALLEDYTFYATYWLGIVEESGTSKKFIDLEGNYKIDNERNISFYSSGGKQIMKFIYKDVEIKEYQRYWNTQTGELIKEERIVSITYEVKKDGHLYLIKFYR